MVEKLDPDEEALRALLKPRRRPIHPRVKGRALVFSEADCRAFTRVLRERIPDVAFLFQREIDEDHHGYFQVAGLDECHRQPYCFAKATVVVPDSSRDVERLSTESIPNGVDRLPHFTVSLTLSTKVFPDTHEGGAAYENRSYSNMYANYFPSDREYANFLARVWRMAGKISTNRVADFDDRTGRTNQDARGYWCGLDALRWCQGSEDRYLTSRYRPRDDWSMPDLPYYD